jgi:hypothetical protein
VKEFISHQELLDVLKLLGLPDDVLSVELKGRDEPFAGVDSSWMLKVTRSRRYTDPGSAVFGGDAVPYTLETIYIPVMLPADEERRRELTLNRERLIAQHIHQKPVEHAFLPDEVDTAEVVAPALRSGGWCAPPTPATVVTDDKGKIVSVAVTRPVRGGVQYPKKADDKEE